jgi:hypothetical protein
LFPASYNAQHEEVPRLLPDEPASHLEPALRHREDLVEGDLVAGAPEIGDVEDVVVPLTEFLDDLGLELAREGP